MYTIKYKAPTGETKEATVPQAYTSVYDYAQFLESFVHATKIIILFKGELVDTYEGGRSLRNFP